MARRSLLSAVVGRLRAGSPTSSPEEEAEQEQSRAALAAGGLPVAAQRRLSELADSGARVFSSDLSVNEFAVLRQLGLQPITQVMGASIFQHGWQQMPYETWYGYSRNTTGLGRMTMARNRMSPGDGSAWARELRYLSDAFNDARRRALDRLATEARLAGADAVVGVRVTRSERAFAGDGTIEFTAIGTAVRLPPALRGAGDAVITDLSGQEYVQLAVEGVRPVGVVGDTTVMYVASGVSQSWVLASGNSVFSMAGRANQELPDFTRGLYDAREVAMRRLSRDATRLGADGIVGVTMDVNLHEREYGDANENHHHDLIVYVHVLGTAIREGFEPLPRPSLRTIMPLQNGVTAGARRLT
jgi:uncharacterized protein YbjQ (UPF0145 family)